MPQMTVQQAIAAGHARYFAGRPSEAEVIYRKVLEAAPDQPEALHYLGVIAYDRRQFGVAIDLMRRSIERGPEIAGYWSNLGLAFAAAGRFSEAIECQRRVIALQADFPEAQGNLADNFRSLGFAAEALGSYRAELALRPDNAKAWNNLGLTYAETGRVAEAIECYREAVRLRPQDAALHSNLLMALHFDPAATEQSICEEHRDWVERHAQPLVADAGKTHENERSTGRRLRIGYVSPDLKAHVVGWSILPVLAHHDRARFEVYCYSDCALPDDVTREIRAHADVWRDTSSLDHARFSDQVRADRIDLLIDLTLHMAQNRMPAFARRPAPVQITYLGYAASTGLPTMDYRIADPHMDPPGQASDGPEVLLRLPSCYWAYRPAVPTPDVKPPPVLANGYVTFGSFNNYRKVNAGVVAAWAALLSQVNGSRFLIVLHGGEHNSQIYTDFESHGIDRGRIRLLPRQPIGAYFRLHEQVDMALDPFPYNGGITSLNALWMGVPVVSRVGERAVGRAGLSLLRNLGLEGLVATDVEIYVQAAVELSKDCDRLARLRGSLRQRLRESPLMNEQRFTRDLEGLYLQAWAQWCAQDA